VRRSLATIKVYKETDCRWTWRATKVWFLSQTKSTCHAGSIYSHHLSQSSPHRLHNQVHGVGGGAANNKYSGPTDNVTFFCTGAHAPWTSHIL